MWIPFCSRTKKLITLEIMTRTEILRTTETIRTGIGEKIIQEATEVKITLGNNTSNVLSVSENYEEKTLILKKF